MNRPEFELATVIKRYGAAFVAQCKPNAYQLSVLNALLLCRTATLGGHRDQCDNEDCAHEHFSYNSCGNRHCPKCQVANQLIWAEDRMRNALNAKHFHLVFTVPEEMNAICLLGSKAFYSAQFAAVWETLHSFGYAHYGAETGAICVLHTWGQNLSLHPHVHCIVPAVGINLRNKLIDIGNDGKFLYPVRQLSTVFRAKLLTKLKLQLKKSEQLANYQNVIDQCFAKPWVVYCEPSLGDAKQVVAYLAKYTHRVAISNTRIISIDEKGVSFSYKDYADQGNQKIMTLSGVEFLRRFCMHILPKRFVKIRYYGILGSRYKQVVQPLKTKPDILQLTETRQQRIVRLTGFDSCKCPKCKTGTMQVVETFPRIRSPSNVYYLTDVNVKQ
ncbi:MAG: transposase [Paludibacter sp.]|nr:transposase [Paludibacter sp.]